MLLSRARYDIVVFRPYLSGGNRNALRVGENLEFLAPHQCDQRHAGRSAVRIASAVGAEMAMSTEAPRIAAFCTISTERRLVTTTAPSLPFTCAGQAAASLSSALCRPTSSRSGNDTLTRHVEAGAMHRPRLAMQRLNA